MNSDEPLSETGFAPNRNLWYHSTLNRDDCDRILSQHGPGSYLVRKSDHSESYRLSVVDPDKRINHYTIELQYGLVMLGSTAYSSLEALVSHFSSKGNLFFDSNLTLCNPVPPSVPSQPKRVRCKFPYTAAPDTDELSVSFGEILIVHDHPEHDWVWAESIITKHSGSVAYDILEPVDPEEDPFLGYPWFNNERSKVEIVADLSSPKCKSGTFIIRPSESLPPGQESDTSRFYTLFVRSKTQIEKLRIERQQNGRLIFGNRDFDSPIDLFDRYAQSEIRPGATLRFPLIIPPASPALPPPKIRLRRLSSSGPRTQKAGWLSVYTTKNAYSDIPSGQWKRYWARLDMDRSKELLTLSLFESGKRTRIEYVFASFIERKIVYRN